ncbi:HlyD family type I secretion periplasmic adaptor subunit [Marinomonas transparens]|uniref:Membrane fusion protein (MFP) family protein n=1 Tax=Marinomonas transparens TaxID=2795388 RepID=A0A934JXD4_9GAMM|nr:HlyD family type I secretion periplasmic adaptor subunit [Marinomonas transparens]MBJ7539957.1 HlyD family type I secretion periplasmic adaptor subunit [Marinomonas transparens]
MTAIQLSSEQKLFGSIRRHILTVSIVIFVLVGGMGVWTGLSSIAGAVVATGTIVVESNTKEVQHREGGIVKAIEVENGDLVDAGDLLIVLDDTLLQSEMSSIVKQLHELYAQNSRLLAEQAGKNEIVFDMPMKDSQFVSLVDSVETNQRAFFHARANSLAGQKSQLKEKISQLEQEIIGFQADSDTKKSEMGFVTRELEDIRPLFEQNLISKTRITELERDEAQLQGAYNVLLAEVAQNKGAIRELEMQVLQLEEDKRVEVLQQLQDTRVNIVLLEKQKADVEDQLKRLNIRAPRSGYVHNLAIHTVGGVVAPGETVTLLVPQKDLLLVEAQIRPVDIEQLYFSQDAKVRFPSFNQKTTPELKATLKTVSADLLQDQQSGVMYYQAMFMISETELSKLNGKSLIPGMPVEVFAKTEERTVLSYLLKPVRDQIVHALRER